MKFLRFFLEIGRSICWPRLINGNMFVFHTKGTLLSVTMSIIAAIIVKVATGSRLFILYVLITGLCIGAVWAVLNLLRYAYFLIKSRGKTDLFVLAAYIDDRNITVILVNEQIGQDYAVASKSRKALLRIANDLAIEKPVFVRTNSSDLMRFIVVDSIKNKIVVNGIVNEIQAERKDFAVIHFG